MVDATSLLAWGASLHYPQIVLRREPRDVLRAGELNWLALFHSQDQERITRLQQRWACWQEREKVVTK